MLFICYAHLSNSYFSDAKSAVMSPDGFFKCPRDSCGKRYKYKPGLYRHLRYECQKTRQFFCYICLKRFYQKVHLQSHMVARHLSSDFNITL